MCTNPDLPDCTVNWSSRLPHPPSRTAPSPRLAEQSHWKRTGRYDEVIKLCKDFVAAYPAQVASSQFGESPEGRPMLALVVSADGVLSPQAAKAKKRPVVLVQGGIHAGEIDGKDAGFLLLRELLRGEVAPGILSKLTWVFVPVFNVDGHERFGKNNRPEPARAGGNGLADHGPELQPQSRLHEGRHAGNGRDAQTPARMGPHPLRRSCTSPTAAIFSPTSR